MAASFENFFGPCLEGAKTGKSKRTNKPTPSRHLPVLPNAFDIDFTIARNVTGRPANRAGARSTLKTVERRKMTAEEEKIALLTFVAVNEK